MEYRRQLYCWTKPHDWADDLRGHHFQTMWLCKNCIMGCKYKPEFVRSIRFVNPLKRWWKGKE